MFVDEVNIKLIGGKGGDGCTSFRREKYVPMGGPDGGNGGHGADIIFTVDKGLKTLIDLKYQKIIKGDKGSNGMGKNKNGKKAEDLIVKVPEGTTIYDKNTGLVICDLVGSNNQFTVCHGGRGGKGNRSFATQENPAPKFSEYGEPGEVMEVHLELKMIADVGLIGMPSVGKSSLLNVISAANPKIAPYHFTTLEPNLGVVKTNDNITYVMADLPGLIEGAANGSGLGHKFLKHAMRTKVLAHVIDMGAFEGRDPIEDYEIIRREVEAYSDKLKKKKEVILANKMDLKGSLDNLAHFKKKYPDLTIYPISTYTLEGINEAINGLGKIVVEVENENLYDEEEMIGHVLYKYENLAPFTITKDDEGVYVIEGKEIEKLLLMTKFTEDESVMRFGRKLKGMGVDDELIRLGANKGDTIQILDYVFQFQEDEYEPMIKEDEID